eukprot:777918-Prymnesium_polylepis.1
MLWIRPENSASLGESGRNCFGATETDSRSRRYLLHSPDRGCASVGSPPAPVSFTRKGFPGCPTGLRAFERRCFTPRDARTPRA